MSDNDLNHAVLNLTAEEKRAYGFLFDQADTDQIGVVTGERAVSFFERTKVQPQVLGEIWQLADSDNRGFLSKPGFCMVLRLIGHVQAGREPSSELAFRPAPIPKFEGLQLPAAPQSPTAAAFPPNVLQPQNSGQPGIRIPPLDPGKVAQFSGLFERSGAQDGLLNGLTAKAIFERAGLPVDVLGKIWTLADREQRGALDQTEFIVAMHLLASMKTKAMTALPNTLPPGFYEAAARRGAPPPTLRQAPVARQVTGSSFGGPARTASPLNRAGFGTPPPNAGPTWLITAAEKQKYDQFFASVDTEGRGILNGEQAVRFFGDSGLPEDTLASIWDLADINSEGQLNKDEFAVAMYLIRQQRTANAAPLPAFLPPALIPPSMRKPQLQQQTQQTTAPAFDNSRPPVLPKSAAEDLFGLDEPAQPAATQPASAATRDPFSTDVPSSPSSPARFQPAPQAASSFKPFIPSSAFGASLASQNTGGSQASAKPAAVPAPRAQPSAMDDLLGDNDAHAEENSKLTSDTTELANLSNQIGNLRGQMEQTQTKKSAVQTDLNASNAQKRDLESRLQQFRAQYEQEVKLVKDLEKQLTTTKESLKKSNQEIALLEGAYQDLQAQHQSVSQALQADQTENATLKQRITELNTTIAQLKPELEKMKLDARQQKGMVSINRKQTTTLEAERDKLQSEKADLEREAAEAAEAAKNVPEPTPATREIASPAGSTLSSTNPFFRKTSQETGIDRAASPPVTSPAPNPSAFDQLFGPSSHVENKNPAPATSFVSRAATAVVAGGAAAAAAVGLTDSVSSDGGKFTPAATPPPSDGARDVHAEETASKSIVPPASSAGSFPSHNESTTSTEADRLPGAFPDETQGTSKVEDDFDSAFASFGNEKVPESANTDISTSAFPQPPASQPGFDHEFAPPQSLEKEYDESDSEDEDDFVHNTAQPSSNAAGKAAVVEPSQPVEAELPKITEQVSPPSYDQVEPAGESDPNAFPKEFTGLLPAREDPTSSPEPVQDEAGTPKALQPQFSFPLQTPTSTTETATSDIFHDAQSRPLSTAVEGVAEPASLSAAASKPKNAFDEFDDFDDLAEAKEADKSGADFDFGFNGHSREDSEFSAAFDSPAASTNNTVPSSQTATGSSAVFGSSSSNGFGPSITTNATSQSANSSIQHTPQGQHDWDAIFSGLDNSNTEKIDTTLGNDPWAPTNGGVSNASSSAFAPTKAPAAPAVTPGTEHDDPILKRLTSMGYSRNDALGALEKYDYDINKAVDHLSS